MGKSLRRKRGEINDLNMELGGGKILGRKGRRSWGGKRLRGERAGKDLNKERGEKILGRKRGRSRGEKRP